MKQIYLYGIAGADQQYRVVKYFNMYEDEFSITRLKWLASVLKDKNPSIERVFAIDNRRGLKRELTESLKKNSIESCYVFLDSLERDGIRIL